MPMVGGGGRSRIFRISNDHKTIYTGLTGTVAATAAASIAFMFGRDVANDPKGVLVSTEFSYDDSGIPTIKYSQAKAGPSLDAFIDAFLPRKAGSSSDKVDELKDETGFKIGGEQASSEQQQGLVMSYLGIDSESDKRGVVCAVGTFKKSSGARKLENAKHVTPPFEFTGMSALKTVDAPVTGISISKDLFDTALVTVPTTPTTYEIPPGYYEKTFWFDPAE